MKKVISLLLSALLIFTVMPITANAYDGTVKAIEFTPSSPREEYFETDGYWDTDGEGERYYFYNVESRGSGDKLTIIDNNDNEHKYTAVWDNSEDECYFVSDEDSNERLKYTGDGNEFSFVNEQNQVGKHLQLGENRNILFLEFRGARAEIPVTIIQNPVTSFEFTPITPFTVIENARGHWDHDDYYGDFFNYDAPEFREGDRISVIFAGESEPVIYTYDGGEFLDENEDEILYRDELFRSKHNEPWTIGGNNKFYIQYCGHEVQVSVTVVANPVTGIDYIRTGTDEYIEGDTRYDSWDDKYYYEHPNFREGDTLIVYEGSLIKEYTFKHDDSYYFFFENVNKAEDTIEVFRENGVQMYDSQNNTPWALGNQNEFYVEYMGKTETLYATVKANPVKSISYTRAEPIEYYEGTEGYDYGEGFEYRVPWERTGDKITVTDNNNVSTVYTCTFNNKTDQTEFVASNGDVLQGEVRFESDQINNPWVVGTNNEYRVTYSGKSCTLYATIKANPVKSLQYTRSEPAVYYENSNGWENDGIWFYNEPDFLDGDTLVVTYTDNSTKTFTYQHSDEMHISAFFAADGELLEDVWTTSNQHQNPWGRNTENVYYVEYLNRVSNPVNVTILENTTKSISVVKASPATVIDGDTREDISPVGGMHYMAYDIPGFVDGDKLIVTDNDNSIKEYVFSEVEIDGRPEHRFVCKGDVLNENEINLYHEQFLTPWSVDGDNFFYVEFRGKTCTVPVSVVSSDVSSISFTLAKPDELVFDENAEGYYDWSQKDFTDSTLTVNYKDNTQKVYALKFDFGGIGAYFENVDDENDKLYQHDVLLYDFQNENRWSPDSDNALIMRYKGVTCEIPVTINHTYVKSTVAPTCTAQGYTLFKCSACNDEYKTDIKKANGHKWNAGKVTKKATAKAAGVMTYTCTVCGATKKEAIKKSAFSAKKKAKTLPAKAGGKTTIKAAKAFVIKNKNGKVTYKKAGGDKKITITKAGKISVAKGLTKGKVYKLKVKVTDGATAKYAAVTKTVTISIKIQ